MKISNVFANDRKQMFEVSTAKKTFEFPYAVLDIRPTPQDPIRGVSVDPELGHEAFTYHLASGAEGTVHIDHVLAYNHDPDYMRDLLLYRLTLAAQECVRNSSLSETEMLQRLNTSPAQFHRLLDQTNYNKSIDQLVSLLYLLDCDVDLVVQSKPSLAGEAG